jgi:hypothetical protein
MSQIAKGQADTVPGVEITHLIERLAACWTSHF